MSVACPASVEFDRVSADDSDGVGVPGALVFLAGAGGVGRVVATVGQWTRLANEVRSQRIYATQAYTLLIYLNDILYTINYSIQRRDNLYVLRPEFGEVSDNSAMRQNVVVVIIYVWIRFNKI